MTAVTITNLVKFHTLLLLSEGPKHGYELIKGLEKALERPISPSQVYPFLRLLQETKYIALKGTGARDKKTYQLTAEGRQFFRSMMNRFGALVETAIRPRLTVCVHCGCKVFEGGHIESVKGKKLKFCCTHCASTYKKLRN